jgi:ATP-binding cassette subfamily B protein
MPRKFPLYTQLDQMDCGPTCLRMITKYYGREYSLAELRQRSAMTKDGVSLHSISDVAESLGFRTIAIRIGVSKLVEEAPLPCIVHWNSSHFVVLHRVAQTFWSNGSGRVKFFVADPAGHLLTYSREEFGRGWIGPDASQSDTGICLLIQPTAEFYSRQLDNGEVPRRALSTLFSYFRDYKWLIVQLLLGLILTSVIQLIFPFLTQSIIDVGINTRNIGFIYLILAGQVMLTFSRTTVDFLRGWIFLHLSTRVNISIVSDFLVKLVELPMSFFDQKVIGDIIRRIEDHTRIEKFLSVTSLTILFSMLNFLVFAIVLLLYNSAIFSLFVIATGCYVTYVLLFLKKRKEFDHKRFSELAKNQGSLIQIIQGIEEIKINSCERKKRWDWENIQAKLFRVTVSTTRLQQLQDAGGTFINEIKNVFITIMAAQSVIAGEMTLGMMLSVQYIIGQMNAPVVDFINFMRDYQDARISLERISEIHNISSEVEQNDALSIPRMETERQFDAGIKLVNLGFRYHEQFPSVLDGVNVSIPDGKITAIVGMSGSGKTSLLKLLLKFYNPSIGDILVAGVNLRATPTKQWRRRCGVVMQDGILFSDTVANNIGMADDEVDVARMIEAAKVANIHEFIMTLPQNYNTKIGAEGVSMSQGQKQRVLIARAVYKDPEFLFFDEATSSLDSNNESVIMKNLNDFFFRDTKNGTRRTVVIIAHRLSTVKNADQIILLDKGKIAEVGTHTELAGRRGIYYSLIRNQLELGN